MGSAHLRPRLERSVQVLVEGVEASMVLLPLLRQVPKHQRRRVTRATPAAPRAAADVLRVDQYPKIHADDLRTGR